MESELVAKSLKKFGLEIEEQGICWKEAVKSKQDTLEKQKPKRQLGTKCVLTQLEKNSV